MTKASKVFWIGISVALGVLVFLIVLAMPNFENSYDVSMMNEVDVNDVLTMFKSEKTYVLFVGREGCSVCEHIIPTLEEAQIKNNYITQYLDISKVDRTSEEWNSLVNRLTMRSTQTLSATGEGETVTETYGYFLHYYGFTPTIIVIREGKQYAGFIGNAEKDQLIAWLTKQVS